MRRIAAVLTACALSLGATTVLAGPALACVGVQCQVECVKRILAGQAGCPD